MKRFFIKCQTFKLNNEMLVTHKPKAMLHSNDKKSGTLPAFVNSHTLQAQLTSFQLCVWNTLSS